MNRSVLAASSSLGLRSRTAASWKSVFICIVWMPVRSNTSAFGTAS